jgi:hypothetical protein
MVRLCGRAAVQPRHACCAGLIEVDEVAAGPQEVAERFKPNDFSLNDGSIRFIWALTAELWSHSASSFSWPMRSARSSSPVAGGLRPRAAAHRRARGRLGVGYVFGFGGLGCDGGYPGQRVAGGGQRPAARTGHADADNVAAEALAALGQRDVVGVGADFKSVRSSRPQSGVT